MIHEDASASGDAQPDTDAFHGVRRRNTTSMRCKEKTKRKIYEEEESLATGVGSARPFENILSVSMRDVFRDIISFTQTKRDIEVYKSNPKVDERISFADSSKDNLKSFIRNVMEKEFPKKDNIPNARDIINVGSLFHNKARYGPGSWVEIEGADLKWRLDMITRVVR